VIIMRRVITHATIAIALSGLAPEQSVAQQLQRDILAGRINGPSGAVAGATISVSAVGAAAGTMPNTARSDAEGRWLVAVQEGTGEYTVRVTAIGMKPLTTTAKRGEPRKPIIVDIKMEASAVTLDAVRVLEARRPRPPREIQAQDRAGSDRPTDGFAGAIAVADQGNLAAMAASVPGITLIPDAGGGPPGFSVLGLGADQNRVTLNGLTFGGGDIPRDAMVVTRVASASYDVSRGGFSGGQLSVTAPTGGNFYQHLLHVTFDAPSLQTTDAVGRRLGAQYTNTQLSGAALGAFVLDKLFYNFSFQAGRRSSDLQTLTRADPFALQRVGVAQDSVTRLLGILGGKGIPFSAAAVPSDRLTDNVSLLGRFDWMPGPDRIGNLLTSVRHNRAMASLAGVTAAPGHGGDVVTNGGDVTGTLSTYLRGSYLNDLRAGAHVNRTASTPYLELPDIRVLVSSRFADSTGGNTTLQFGGNPGLPRSVTTGGAEVYDNLSWFTVDRRHRIRITTNARADAFSQEQYANRRGTYTYNSIADVEADRPSSFSRVFVGQRAAAKSLTGAFSVGDEWRPNERSQFMYGARIDANGFIDRPAYNPDVAARFGARTDFVPRVVDISPRLGFFRAFGTNGTTGIPGFGAPWGNVRGGIGMFRNDVSPTLVAPALLASGLADGVRQIGCIGSAVPAPDWNAFLRDPNTIPAQCADTAATSPFVTTRPNVWLVDHRFAAQRSWRANLALNVFLIPKLVRFTVEGVYSLNLHQQSPLDLNFAPNARFSLGAEANRPVYAAPASIVPFTGALTNHDSRMDGTYGGVSALVTDLHSYSRQLIFTVFPAPGDALGRFTQWQAAYALQSVREQSRGFAGTTAANPLAIETARGSLDLRHQVTLSFSTRVGSFFSVATTARFASGAPFTPIVNGDINGDGLANDRAFVPSTSLGTPSSADSAVRAGMSALLAGAPSRVRDCIARQLGRIAARNSCEGPWTATMNANLTLNPEKLGMQNRTQLTLSLTNLPAGLDALLHGTSHLQGWGQSSASDPTLLLVRGFDPAAQRFRYEVNPRFGDTRMSRSGVRSPFLVTLEARVQLGRDFTRQAIEQALAPGRTRPGDRVPMPMLKQRLLGAVFNPVRGLLQAKDSLSILSNEQLRLLTQLDRRVSAKEDSIVTPVAEYLAGLPKEYSEADVLERVLRMAGQLFETVVDGMKTAREIFTPEQINEFPPFLRASFDIKRLMSTKPTKGFDPQW
jgi:hypothetical protein